jgi:hypothetical protein
MSSGLDEIAEGRAAWSRLRQHERASWSDWLAVGRALAVGRTIALKFAKTNRAVGTTYNRAMRLWLADNGLADVIAQERYRVLLIIEQLDAIEAWRAGLDDARRCRLNHPNAIWHSWRRATVIAQPRHIVRNETPHKPDKPIYWSQDVIRRAALAMRPSGSTDYFILARTCLAGCRAQPRRSRRPSQRTPDPRAGQAACRIARTPSAVNRLADITNVMCLVRFVPKADIADANSSKVKRPPSEAACTTNLPFDHILHGQNHASGSTTSKGADHFSQRHPKG